MSMFEPGEYAAEQAYQEFLSEPKEGQTNGN